MKLKLEEVQGREPRTKVIAVPAGETFRDRYYKIVNAAAKKHISFHEKAVDCLEKLCAEYEEMLKIERGA